VLKHCSSSMFSRFHLASCLCDCTDLIQIHCSTENTSLPFHHRTSIHKSFANLFQTRCCWFNALQRGLTHSINRPWRHKGNSDATWSAQSACQASEPWPTRHLTFKNLFGRRRRSLVRDSGYVACYPLRCTVG